MKKNELAQKVKKLRLLEDDVFNAVFAQVDEIKPLDNVNEISHNIATVKFSELGSGLCLSPEYYISDCQKNAIRTTLNRCGKDIGKITQKIEEMLFTKCAFSKNGKDNKVYLNENSLAILQEMFNILK